MKFANMYYILHLTVIERSALQPHVFFNGKMYWNIILLNEYQKVSLSLKYCKFIFIIVRSTEFIYLSEMLRMAHGEDLYGIHNKFMSVYIVLCLTSV